MKLELESYEVVKIEEKTTENEDGESTVYRYILQGLLEKDKITLQSPAPLTLTVGQRNLSVVINNRQTRLDRYVDNAPEKPAATKVTVAVKKNPYGLNEHGVYTKPEIVKPVKSTKSCSVELELAETDVGTWVYGYDFKLNTNGSMGPCSANSGVWGTRQEALCEAALMAWRHFSTQHPPTADKLKKYILENKLLGETVTDFHAAANQVVKSKESPRTPSAKEKHKAATDLYKASGPDAKESPSRCEGMSAHCEKKGPFVIEIRDTLANGNRIVRPFCRPCATMLENNQYPGGSVYPTLYGKKLLDGKVVFIDTNFMEAFHGANRDVAPSAELTHYCEADDLTQPACLTTEDKPTVTPHLIDVTCKQCLQGVELRAAAEKTKQKRPIHYCDDPISNKVLCGSEDAPRAITKESATVTCPDCKALLKKKPKKSATTLLKETEPRAAKYLKATTYRGGSASRWECPSCKAKFTRADSQTGKVTKCKECGQECRLERGEA